MMRQDNSTTVYRGYKPEDLSERCKQDQYPSLNSLMKAVHCIDILSHFIYNDLNMTKIAVKTGRGQDSGSTVSL